MPAASLPPTPGDTTLPDKSIAALLDWYARQRRDLPWRGTRDPYAILVSESMLQQTGVERVIPKFAAFLERFPTLHALAAAPSGDVIRLWSGLGYNRRAVWLQQACRKAIERWGRLPQAIEDLLGLPGIGPYTARAVACFAFGQQVAVCDTNVRRVLSRFALGEARAARTAAAAMQSLADRLLPVGQAYEWNQAVMELGATTCTHAVPRCPVCPLQNWCRAFPLAAQQPRKDLNALAEPRPSWKEEAFIGSRRYYRGRIVESLRRLAPGERLAFGNLGAQVKENYAESDLEWLRQLVSALAADGLAHIEGDSVSLPP